MRRVGLVADRRRPLARASTPQPGETLADQRTFCCNVIDEVETLDRAFIGVVDDSVVARHPFEGLMSRDPAGHVVPGAVTGFEVSVYALAPTSTPRPEAAWSNGEPVRAQDFVVPWRRVVDPATASNRSRVPGLARVVSADAVVAGEAPPGELGVATPDGRAPVATLSRPAPFVPQITADPNLVPVLQSNVEAFGAAWT